MSVVALAYNELSLVASGEINVGTHPRVSILGLGVNSDTVLSTVVAGAILIGLGLYMRSQITAGVPGKLQVGFEGLVGYVENLVGLVIVGVADDNFDAIRNSGFFQHGPEQFVVLWHQIER